MLSHVLARCHCSTSIPTKRRSAQRKYTTSTVMRTGSGWDGGVPFSCRMSLLLPASSRRRSGTASSTVYLHGKCQLIRWRWCHILSKMTQKNVFKKLKKVKNMLQFLKSFIKKYSPVYLPPTTWSQQSRVRIQHFLKDGGLCNIV